MLKDVDNRDTGGRRYERTDLQKPSRREGPAEPDREDRADFRDVKADPDLRNGSIEEGPEKMGFPGKREARKDMGVRMEISRRLARIAAEVVDGAIWTPVDFLKAVDDGRINLEVDGAELYCDRYDSDADRPYGGVYVELGTNGNATTEVKVIQHVIDRDKLFRHCNESDIDPEKLFAGIKSPVTKIVQDNIESFWTGIHMELYHLPFSDDDINEFNADLKRFLDEAVEIGRKEFNQARDDWMRGYPEGTKTVEIPSWALCYIVNGDKYGMDDHEIKMVDDWMEKNGISDVDVVGREPYFSSSPEFGGPAEVYDCVLQQR